MKAGRAMSIPDGSSPLQGSSSQASNEKHHFSSIGGVNISLHCTMIPRHFPTSPWYRLGVWNPLFPDPQECGRRPRRSGRCVQSWHWGLSSQQSDLLFQGCSLADEGMTKPFRVGWVHAGQTILPKRIPVCVPKCQNANKSSNEHSAQVAFNVQNNYSAGIKPQSMVSTG